MSKEVMYISENVDDVENAEKELEQQGISRNAIHILSEDEYQLATHNLPSIPDFEKSDLIRKGWIGAGIGITLAIIFLGLTAVFQWHVDYGWPLFGFIAVMIAGFCTWEGGLIGISTTNHRFEPIYEKIKKGSHLVLVKTSSQDESKIKSVFDKYSSFRPV